jgi:hypothetical protein
VADAQTRVLMMDYYQLLLKGEGRSKVLRGERKTMVATRYPYYSTAFVPIDCLDTSGGERVSLSQSETWRR